MVECGLNEESKKKEGQGERRELALTPTPLPRFFFSAHIFLHRSNDLDAWNRLCLGREHCMLFHSGLSAESQFTLFCVVK